MYATLTKLGLFTIAAGFSSRHQLKDVEEQFAFILVPHY